MHLPSPFPPISYYFKKESLTKTIYTTKNLIMNPLSQTSELHRIFMLPSVYVILARSLQQKSRLQTNEQRLVNSGVQRDRTSNHFSSFPIILVKLLKRSYLV